MRIPRLPLWRHLPKLIPNRVLLVLAHPDDDVCAAGTIAYWKSLNPDIEVFYLIVSDGSAGIAGTDDDAIHKVIASVRRDEQIRACKHLGVPEANVMFAEGIKDGEIENTKATRKIIVRAIRLTRPDVIITWDPTPFYDRQVGTWNHRDHRQVGEATGDAIYPDASNPAALPDLMEKEGLKPWAVNTLLLMSEDGRPNYFVRLSADHVAARTKAAAEHNSQGSLEQVIKLREATQGRRRLRYRWAAGIEAFVRLDYPPLPPNWPSEWS